MQFGPTELSNMPVNNNVARVYPGCSQHDTWIKTKISTFGPLGRGLAKHKATGDVQSTPQTLQNMAAPAQGERLEGVLLKIL